MYMYTLTAEQATNRADLWEQVKRGEARVTAGVIGRQQLSTVELVAALGFNAKDSRWYFDVADGQQFACSGNYTLTVTRLTAQNVSEASSAPRDLSLPETILELTRDELLVLFQDVQGEMQELGDLLALDGVALRRYGTRHVIQRVADLIKAAQAVLDELGQDADDLTSAQALRDLVREELDTQ